jgi:hypothetical protein
MAKIKGEQLGIAEEEGEQSNCHFTKPVNSGMIYGARFACPYDMSL